MDGISLAIIILTMICLSLMSLMIYLIVIYLKANNSVNSLENKNKYRGSSGTSISRRVIHPLINYSNRFSKEIFHFENKAFVFHDNIPTSIKYSLHFSNLNDGKLVVNLKNLEIGGLNAPSDIRTLLTFFNQIYVRVYLNNNYTNSIVVTERITFHNFLLIKEVFMFKLKKHSLKSIILIFDLYVSLSDRDSEYNFGWLEVKLNDDLTLQPKEGYGEITNLMRPIDRFVKVYGYLCIGLQSIFGALRIKLFAAQFDKLNSDNMNEKKAIYIRLKCNQSSSQTKVCQSAVKILEPIVVLNEIFILPLQQEVKAKETQLELELWNVLENSMDKKDPGIKVGCVYLGSFNEEDSESELNANITLKAKNHWDKVMKNDNKEIVNWHVIYHC